MYAASKEKETSKKVVVLERKTKTKKCGDEIPIGAVNKTCWAYSNDHKIKVFEKWPSFVYKI
jgi:hypothetical protein